MIVAIGTNDTLASPGAQLDYYQSVIDKMGRAQVDRFARFFVMPQTGHGLSGTNYGTSGDGKTLAVAPVPNTCDRLALLFDWVERGVAPGMSITVSAGEKSLPLCSYPDVSEVRQRAGSVGVIVSLHGAMTISGRDNHEDSRTSNAFTHARVHGRDWRLPPVSRRDRRPAGSAVTAGEFLVDPPTLINLGFEWFIEGDDNRNASVDVSYRKQGDDRLEARRCRCCGCRASASSRAISSTSISPNMFAGSILDLEPDTAYEARFVLRDPDGVSGAGARRPSRCARGPSRCRRRAADVYHVYPPGYQGREDRAVVRRPDVRVQPHLRRHRLGDGRPAAREGRRHHPRARRPLQVQPLRIHERSGRESHDAARRHVLPDRERHRREADRRSRAPATARRSSTAPATSRCSTSGPPTTPTSRG